MKHKISILLLSLLAVFSITTGVKADEYLRVGMEAAYAPFNWTQEDDSNGAVPIEGTNQFANGYDVQVAKKIAESMNKELLVVKTKWEGLVPALTSGKIDMIITKSISRFARNTLDCLKYIRQLKDKNIAVFFEKENINTMDSKGEVLLTIMASLAQQESQSLSQNVKLGIQYRYQQGEVQVNHKRFLGYTKDENK